MCLGLTTDLGAQEQEAYARFTQTDMTMEEGNLQIFMGDAPASLLPEPEPEPEEEETADAEEPEEVARIPMMEEDEVEKLEQQLDFQEVKPHPLLPFLGLGPLPLLVSRDFDAKFLIELVLRSSFRIRRSWWRKRSLSRTASTSSRRSGTTRPRWRRRTRSSSTSDSLTRTTASSEP